MIFDCPPTAFKPRITPSTAVTIDFTDGAITSTIRRVWDVTYGRQARSFDTLGAACAHVRGVVR